MLSSARGSPELRRRSASDAEVSAVAEGATGSKAAPPGDRGGGTRGGGRGSAATTSSTGEAKGAERRGDTPAPKPDPETGRMDHHQLGTGRYQVVSARAPGRTIVVRRPGGPLPAQPPAAADGLHPTKPPSPALPNSPRLYFPSRLSFSPDSDTREP